ncbi:dysbindin-like [Diadema antillarum]|uniref:dysbindin-like n=1 Tax=Diadema antillarum TaxID=105358 RepID=UPI003A85B52D
MFDQFKEKIQSVQQDLNAGLKSLSEKAREVGRSKKLPGELHVLENKQGTLSALKPEYVDAGEEILNRFQQLWTQIHVNIEYSADKAVKQDKVIQDMVEQHEKDVKTFKELQTHVQEMPDMVSQIQTLAVTLGKLEADFEEIETMLEGLEDTCEEEELLNNKKIQLAEFVRYKEQKAKERELRRERLMDEYNQKFRRLEEKEDAKKKERQKAFQDVFAADMAHYRTHGKMSKLVTQSSKDLESTLDDFELTVNADDQQALDDFLGPDEGSVVVTATKKEAKKEEEEEEEEEVEETEETEETEEEERVDVTKFPPVTETEAHRDNDPSASRKDEISTEKHPSDTAAGETLAGRKEDSAASGKHPWMNK